MTPIRSRAPLLPQNPNLPPPARPEPLSAEWLAQVGSTATSDPRSLSGAEPVDIARVPNVVRWAASALRQASDNLARGVSRGHMSRHFQRLAQHGGKSVFRNPRDAPGLVTRTLSEARDVALRRANDIAAGRVVREGSIEVAQQGNRLAVTRRFDRAIGQAGESHLRVVVGRTGQIVTAYPVRSAAAAGAFFGVTGLGEQRANAMYSRFDQRVDSTAAQVQAAQQRRGFDFVNELIGLLDPTGIFYAEPVNTQEAAWLATRDGANAAVADIEAELGRRLSDHERSVFRSRFVSAVQTAVAIREDR